MVGLTQHYVRISKSLLRVPTYLLISVYALMGLLTAVYMYGEGVLDWHVGVKFLLCLILMAFWYMNATALNDYADYKIDMINLKDDPDRPLVTGQASRQELKVLAMAYAACGLMLAAVLSPFHLALFGCLLLLNYAYSMKPFQLSHRGVVAPLLLPLGYVLLPYMLSHGIVEWRLNRPSMWLLGALYLQFIGRIILKDYRDVKGDAAHGKRTFLLRHGNAAVCIVSGLSIAASALIAMSTIKMGVLKFPLIVLSAYALTILYNVAKTSTWPKQKPLLSAYGRAMTGVTVSIIAALLSLTWSFGPAETYAVALAIVFAYLWSARQAFLYNTHKLSTKKS